MVLEESKRIERLNELISNKSIYFPSAEIYSKNFSGFFDYGPIGNKIRLNIIDFWRKELVRKNNFLEISGSLILPEDVFRSSGHLGNFDDPISTCKKCGEVYRLDKILSNLLEKEVPENLTNEEYEKLLEDNEVLCTKCKTRIDNVSRFNLMANIIVGAKKGQKGYLRGESCQSIFLDFLRLYKTSRVSLPVAISQHGLVYRNEISPRNGLLRAREFEQLETELFFDKDKINDVNLEPYFNKKIRYRLLKDDSEKDYTVKEVKEQNISFGDIITYYTYLMNDFLEKIGIKHENIRFREVSKEDRAFYSKQTFDLEVKTNKEWVELFCINYRTDHDLKAHAEGSKSNLSVKEEGKEILPHVLEVSSIGLGRLLYLILENSFEVIDINDDGKDLRNVLKLKPKISPYFMSVFPLVKKDGLLELSKDIYSKLVDSSYDLFETNFDEKGSIGKRYARMDEIGCNFCITVDHDTLEDKTITIRDRDSFDQKRISIDKLLEVSKDLYLGKITFKDL